MIYLSLRALSHHTCTHTQTHTHTVFYRGLLNRFRKKKDEKMGGDLLAEKGGETNRKREMRREMRE